MPELPEVETIRAGLARLLPGKAVKDVWYDWDKSFPNAPADVARFLVGSEIGRGQRFGAGHPGKELVGELPAKSTRVVLDFKDGSKLFFNDQRKFGWMRLMPTLEIPEIDFFKKVGPEPLDDDFTVDKFIERLMRRQNSNIKSVLLDQTVVAGIGNIYADESLWSAKIHPATIVKDIPKPGLVLLYNAVRDVLNLSIQKGGSTDKNYVDAEGKKGSYLSFANVFRKEGQPCPRCGTPIEKIRVAGRGTHICPRDQKAPK
jgi:formamidopyrimidine-DNA glycosylase